MERIPERGREDMATDVDRTEFVKEFERTIALAKAKAYSKISLERPLSDSEFKAYNEAMKELGVI